MNSYFKELKAHIEADPPNFGDGESMLTMLYGCDNKSNPYDNEQIKENFNELYRLMNGMELWEMDKISSTRCAGSAGITNGLASWRALRLESCCKQN